MSDRIEIGKPVQCLKGLVLLYPQPSTNYCIIDGKLVMWKVQALGPLPLIADLQAADALVSSIDTLRSGLHQAYIALPLGVQATYQVIYDAAMKLFIAGDVPKARETIATAPVAPDVEPAKAAILAAIDAAFPPAN